MRKTSFNDGWIFHEGGGEALAGLLGTTSISKGVTLPHDASIEKNRCAEEPNGSGNGFFKEENCHYTKEFTLNKHDVGKTVWIEFEGVYQNTYVYINNSFAGQCPYGYGNFFIDATKYMNFDKKNTIKVIVKNGIPSGRWYTGGGIYRNVNLLVAERLHVVPDGVHLAAIDIEKDQAVVRVESIIEYTGTGVRDVTLNMQLRDDQGVLVAEDNMVTTIEENIKNSYIQKIYVTNPKLWDSESPYLYRYSLSIMENDVVIDTEEGTFGIRKLQLDTKYGLRINGNVVKLRGGCIHRDNGIIGAADFAHAADFRIQKLKEAGYNAIRSSHYPMCRNILNACDRLGMLVMDEYTDVWTSTKVEFDYGMNMAKWWEHDVTNMVYKAYNHPSVIMYSIGNEIPETGNKFDVQWGKKLADKIRTLDDSRYITNSLNLMLSIMDRLEEMTNAAKGDGDDVNNSTGIDEDAEINSTMNSMGDRMNRLIQSEVAGRATEEAFDQVDIAGYNYAVCRYEQDGKLYPNRIILGSETYPKDLDVNWELIEKYPYLIGDFSWTAWDYLGEAGIGKITYGEARRMSFYAPYPCKSAYCGDINLIGDRRPISYWREIIWGLRKKPYLAVQPPQYHGIKHNMTNWSMTDAVHSWNWKGYEGEPITVEVYADADEAELLINGKLIETKRIGVEKKAQAFFETIYMPGTLEVVTYKDAVEVGRDSIVTAQDKVQIAASVDRIQIPADKSDICYLDISIVDADGNLNTDAKPAVTLTLEGAGTIIGYGSADPDSEENYFDETAIPFEGRLRAAIRGNGVRGKITILAKANGLEDAEIQVEAI